MRIGIKVGTIKDGRSHKDLINDVIEASSGRSLVKYKTADEAWRLINDVIEATQYTKVRNNHSKSVAKVSQSDSALTKTLGEMTNLLKQIHQSQQSSPSMLSIQAPPQILYIEGPPRLCGVWPCTLHYTD
ncbi:hypothetical protein AHAS_Ahas20G0182200 [Arachis hypogaea]